MAAVRADFVEGEHLVKAVELGLGGVENGRIRIGKVRINPLNQTMLAVKRRFQQRICVVVMHPNALHARVDFQVDFGLHTHFGGGFVNLGQLFDGGGGEGEVVLQKERHLVADDAAQHQNRRGEARLAQQNALFQKGDAEVRCAQRDHMPGDLHQPMPISVGLEDGHHFGRGNGAFDSPVIFRQAGQIYFNVGWADNAVAANRWFIQSHALILPNHAALAILLF